MGNHFELAKTLLAQSFIDRLLCCTVAVAIARLPARDSDALSPKARPLLTAG